MARVDVDLSAGNLTINGTWNGDALHTLGLTSCGVSAIARSSANNSEASTGICWGPATITNLTPGSYVVRGSHWNNWNFLSAEPQNVTITGGQTTSISLAIEARYALVKGAVTLNGATGNNLYVCARSGFGPNGEWTPNAISECSWIYNGTFKFLLPGGDGTLTVSGQSGNELEKINYSALAGETKDVGTIAAATGDLRLSGTYNGQELHTLGLSTCGISAIARHMGNNSQASTGICWGGSTLTNLSTGEYEVRGSHWNNWNFVSSDPRAVNVAGGQVTLVTLPVEAKYGLVHGNVTLNGAVGNNLYVCARSGFGPNGEWTPNAIAECTWIYNGSFKFLLPAGAGSISINGQSGNELEKKNLTVTAGQPTDVGTIAAMTGNLTLNATFKGEPVHTLGLTTCGVSAIATHSVNNSQATTGICWGQSTISNLTPGTYQVRGSHWNNWNFVSADPQDVTVAGGQTASVSMELESKFGLVSGNIRLNGQPGNNLYVCVRTGFGPNGEWTPNAIAECSWIYNGVFKFLVPMGCGTGTVSGPSGNVLGNFNYCIETAGEEEDVGNPVEPADNTPPVVTPTISGTQGTGGWYTSDVTVSWSVTDAESEITTPACAASTVTANTTGTTFSCTATSEGGTTTESVDVKRDASAPSVAASISGTLGANGWYVSDVAVSWNVSDAESLISSSTGCANATLTSDVATQSYACSATNGAGLSASDAVTIKRDATKPEISFAGNTGAYTVDQTVSISCSASDALSELAQSVCPGASGSAYEFTIGNNTLSASATDRAGNVRTATANFTVAVTHTSLCTLVERFVTNAGVANSLCVKLRNAARQADKKAAELQSFQNELRAQSGKHVPADKATLLANLAASL